MKYFFTALLLLFPLLSYTQIYQAGQSYQTNSAHFTRWDFSAGGVLSVNTLKESRSSETLFDAQYGAELRGLFYPFSFLGIGLQGQYFTAEVSSSPINEYNQTRLGLLVKAIPAPEFFPRSYFIFGYGNTKREAELFKKWAVKENSPYYMLGLGAEEKIWKQLTGAIEVRGVYNKKKNLGSLFTYSHHWEYELALRLGWLF